MCDIFLFVISLIHYCSIYSLVLVLDKVLSTFFVEIDIPSLIHEKLDLGQHVCCPSYGNRLDSPQIDR